MAVTLHIPRVFRRFTEQTAALTVPFDGSGPGTVRDVLEHAFQRFPELRERVLDRDGHLYPYLVLFRNDETVLRTALEETTLRDGDELELVGAVVGGCSETAAGEGVPASGQPASGLRDVRMRGFRQRLPLATAVERVLDGVTPLAGEEVETVRAAGRILVDRVVARHPVPGFRRSAMDGFALRAEDSFGATDYDPLTLRVVGEVLPGGDPGPGIRSGEAVRIMTGAPVPDGADAVLKAEEARDHGDRVEVLAQLPPGKNVGRIGEDIALDDEVLPAGRRLRPQDIGVLASIGVGRVRVRRRPRVRLLITGNELLPPGSEPSGARIVDSNSPVLGALLERDGAVLESIRRLPDEREAIRAALLEPGVDVVIGTGGSSVGKEDFLPGLVSELGALIFHGIAMRPSAPTGFGRIAERAVYLLPGNPVSCFAAYDVLVRPRLQRLGGRVERWPYPRLEAPLGRRIVSQVGRVDYVRVRLRGGRVEPLATSGASILSSTTRADGFLLTPEGSEGLAEGETATIFLYETERAG